jgi:hypothetical protein
VAARGQARLAGLAGLADVRFQWTDRHPGGYTSDVRIQLVLGLSLLVGACTKASDQPASAKATGAPPATVATPSDKHMGAPIASDAPIVALAAVVKDPAAYKGKSFVTSGTVTAVCQQMGCWMEIKDDATEAHIKMAGEKFFVPKASAGHKARVQGALVDAAGDDDAECQHDAEKQMGKQVAKLQLEATGVELD